MITIKRKIPTPPHKGIVTNHHDQAITLVNFNIKNTKNSAGIKGILPSKVLIV